MSACDKFLGATALTLAFAVAANAQAPQTEKNVSMKMALMIIDGALEQCSRSPRSSNFIRLGHSTGTRLPAPEGAKAGAMPAHNRLRPHDRHRIDNGWRARAGTAIRK